MAIHIFNTVMRKYMAMKYRSVARVMNSPHDIQAKWFNYLVAQGQQTKYGQQYNLYGGIDQSEFASCLPMTTYEGFKPWIDRAMNQESHVLWPDRTSWYAQSSGTTAGRSKFIPVTRESLTGCHIKGFTDALSIIYHQFDDADIFSGLSMTMAGSIRNHEVYDQARVGDISAIILSHMPWIGKPFYALDESIAYIEDWEEKLNKSAEFFITQPDITLFGGVPTWNIILFRRMLDLSGKSNMTEIWPRAKTYIHGGVGFEPYIHQFKQFFPRPDFLFQETYNASEGFFGAQENFNADDLLLMLDSGIYYEFLPLTEINSEQPIALNLKDITTGEKYALVITTNAGLWRYMPGDVVKFTQIEPYKIKIVGRTKHFINAFGEEVIVDNADQALAMACKCCEAKINEYTVAPIYFEEGKKASHEWAIEFSDLPKDLTLFNRKLDRTLQKINSDYQAKRYKNLALTPPKINVLPVGTFHKWMKTRGQFGAQNKIPRLSNSREYINEVLEINKHNM